MLKVHQPRASHESVNPGWPSLASLFGARARTFLGVAAALLLITGAGRAQVNLQPVLFSRSVSGQFLVQSVSRMSTSPLASYLENDTNFIRLDPTLLTVSCERIKQLVWHELGATDP